MRSLLQFSVRNSPETAEGKANPKIGFSQNPEIARPYWPGIKLRSTGLSLQRAMQDKPGPAGAPSDIAVQRCFTRQVSISKCSRSGCQKRFTVPAMIQPAA